jgi:hypothetical protein
MPLFLPTPFALATRFKTLWTLLLLDLFFMVDTHCILPGVEGLSARFWTTSSSTGDDSGPDAIQIAATALTLQKPSGQVSLDPALAAFRRRRQ